MKGTSQRLKLTERSVKSALPLITDTGQVQPKVYFDTDLKGFGLAVGAKTKTFFVQRDVNHRGVRAKIGRVGVITVDQARKEAKKLIARMDNGENPNETRRKKQERGITLRQAWDLYRESMRAKGRKESSIVGYQADLKRLDDWMDRPLAEISRADVRKRHQDIAKEVVKNAHSESYTGLAAANLSLRVFRAVYNRAMCENEYLPANPCINIDWNPVRVRPASLLLTDLHGWHAQVMLLPNPIRRDYLLFALFTGLRKTNAAEVQWQHVDFENRLVHIPKPKSGRPFDLPLTDFLLELLEERKRQNAEVYKNSLWAFPALSQSGHIEEPKEHFDGLKWRIHDLRKMFITVAESLDISPYAVKLLVNHSLKGTDVTGGYIQPNVERLRAPMQAITDRLMILCTPPDDKVKVLPSISGKKMKAAN